ncbi:MAG: flagellar basal body P-ring protein FlgI [Phycisphaerae bacterium]|nr:flagellar basal body P-ring protein FlgI [Phycisphaerae bacterium]
MDPRIGRIGRWLAVRALLCAFFALGCVTRPASALSLQEMARLEGQGETTLWGLGFVVGLGGTGDPSEVLPLARQLAKLLERGGNPTPQLEDLAKGKNIAMVMVSLTVPKEGARRGDKIDVSVHAWHRAQSLKGGQLFITPLQGPLPGQGVYAFAEGPLMFDGDSLTSGKVRGGGRISRDITMTTVSRDGSITLVIEPSYAGWTTSQLVASVINSERQGLDDTAREIAVALDERSVRVQIPEAELADPAYFISSIQEIRLDPTLLSLPARVIVNERRGTIVVTGDVQISPAVISHKDLVVTTIMPTREPTVANPKVERSRWASVDTTKNTRETGRLQDLLEALKRLDVSVDDQIAILQKLHKIGRMHCEFIVE